MPITELLPPQLDLGPRFAGHEDPRDSREFEALERRARGLPVIRFVVQQRSVEICEDGLHIRGVP